MSDIYNILASVTKYERSAFGISFPAIPGCFSAADTWDEIIPMATEALALHCDDIAYLSDYCDVCDGILDEIMWRGRIADASDKNAMYILIPVRADEFLSIKGGNNKND